MDCHVLVYPVHLIPNIYQLDHFMTNGFTEKCHTIMKQIILINTEYFLE